MCAGVSAVLYPTPPEICAAMRGLARLVRKIILFYDAILDEAPALFNAEFLFVRLPVAISPFGGLPLKLFVPFTIPNFHDGLPLFGRHLPARAPIF